MGLNFGEKSNAKYKRRGVGKSMSSSKKRDQFHCVRNDKQKVVELNRWEYAGHWSNRRYRQSLSEKYSILFWFQCMKGKFLCIVFQGLYKISINTNKYLYISNKEELVYWVLRRNMNWKIMAKICRNTNFNINGIILKYITLN